MNRPWNTIDRWLERQSREQNINSRKTGSSLITTPEEEADIALICAENLFKTSEDIKDKLDLKCSARTVDRVIKSIGLNPSIAARSSESHKKSKFEFCDSYKHWGDIQWPKMIFIGKVLITLYYY